MDKKNYYKITLLPAEPRHRYLYVVAESKEEAVRNAERRIDLDQWTIIDVEKTKEEMES